MSFPLPGAPRPPMPMPQGPSAGPPGAPSLSSILGGPPGQAPGMPPGPPGNGPTQHSGMAQIIKLLLSNPQMAQQLLHMLAMMQGGHGAPMPQHPALAQMPPHRPMPPSMPTARPAGPGAPPSPGPFTRMLQGR